LYCSLPEVALKTSYSFEQFFARYTTPIFTLADAGKTNVEKIIQFIRENKHEQT